jgi:hypothetical protein
MSLDDVDPSPRCGAWNATSRLWLNTVTPRAIESPDRLAN